MWIRSQDRASLVEAKRLIVYKKQDKFRIINQVLYMGDISDDYDILGEYESEGRSIEVLDEIQKHMEDLNRQIRTDLIYKMPEK